MRVLFVCILLLFCVGISQADIIQNGSFELAASGTPPGGNYTTVFAGGVQPIANWTVSFGSVDWINTYWQASDGRRSLDMSGNGAGVVLQTSIATVMGQQYLLEFDMAGNPDGGPMTKQMTVTIAGIPHTFTFVETGHTKTNMGWTEKSVLFTATSSATSLSFKSDTTTAYGPALDDVHMTPVPEPATITLMAAGALGLLRRRLRR